MIMWLLPIQCQISMIRFRAVLFTTKRKLSQSWRFHIYIYSEEIFFYRYALFLWWLDLHLWSKHLTPNSHRSIQSPNYSTWSDFRGQYISKQSLMYKTRYIIIKRPTQSLADLLVASLARSWEKETESREKGRRAQ